MKYDCHYHYYGDNIDELKNTVYYSAYYNKYMCYHCIDFTHLQKESKINSDTIYFMIPFVLKETNIHKANLRLLQFSNNKHNIMQFPLLGDQINEYSNFKQLLGFKEHFLLHDYHDCKNRHIYYQYLNDNKKILLLHCKDDIRFEYIKQLRTQYPDMYIQIAHLGVYRKNIELTKELLLYFKDDKNIYYDISTIHDLSFISDIYNDISHQLLYGTDKPYDKEVNIEYIDILNKNAKYLVKSVYNRCPFY